MVHTQTRSRGYTSSGLAVVKSSHFSKEPGASEMHGHFRPKLGDACAVQAEPPEEASQVMLRAPVPLVFLGSHSVTTR